MFKVPDWGKDIPKSDVDVSNYFSNKHKKKSPTNGVTSKIKENESNNKKGTKQKKNVNGVVNLKNKTVKKLNGHAKLSTNDHVYNRMLKRNLKNTTTEVKDIETYTVKNTKGSIQDRKSHVNGLDINNKMKSKILKRKLKINSKTNETKFENNNKVKQGVNSNSAKSRNVARKRLNNGSIKNTSEENGIDIQELTINNKTNETKFENNNKVKQGVNSNSAKSKTVARKRLNNGSIKNTSEENGIDIQSYNSDELDKVLVNAKRKKLNDKIKNEDREDVLFGNKNTENNEQPTVPLNKVDKVQKKKEKIKEVLKKDSNRNIIKTSGDRLRMRMLERLKAAQFRYLNEQLYTSSGAESQELFKSDPAAFQVYHEGYQQQVKKWPINPLDIIVKRIAKMPKTHVIADMGCGEAALSKRVSQRVHSFDLVARAPGVTACDMARTPLLTASADVAVYCLALMGTDLTRYLLEANRVLKIGGHLLIAEVESRFDNPEAFSSDVQRLGFSLKNLDRSHKVFIFMEFNKVRDAPSKKNKLPELSLKPCLYKRR